MTRHVTNMTIDDADHFSDGQKAEIIASYPDHEREARVKGIPALGSGRIYPVADELITVAPFAIPTYWTQIAALDFGWEHPTAAVNLAWDRDTDTVYVTKVYRRKNATPVEHCATLKGWSAPWWAWPHDGLQHDKQSGKQLRHAYEEHGLNMLSKQAQFPDGGNGVEAGLQFILERMQTGRFKVFSHLTEWFDEFRLYHRKTMPDGSSKIVKLRDDLMDATRYGVMCLRFAEHGLEDEEVTRDWAQDGRSDASGY